MKDTGIVRKLDELGRITIPMETRKTLNLEDRAELEIYVENGKIILSKPAEDKLEDAIGNLKQIMEETSEIDAELLAAANNTLSILEESIRKGKKTA